MADLHDVFPARIRGLQAIYQPAHTALINWGAWSRDRAGIFPAGIVSPTIWDAGAAFGQEEEQVLMQEKGWGEAEAVEGAAGIEKAEREHDPYSELAGSILDERLHSPGGPNQEIRRVLRIVYVLRDTHESLYPRAAGCGHDAFCERLETGLLFCGRFV